MNDIAEKYAKLREELDNKDPLVRYAKLKEELNNKDPVKRYVRIKEEINSIKKESSHKFEENKQQREEKTLESLEKLFQSLGGNEIVEKAEEDGTDELVTQYKKVTPGEKTKSKARKAAEKVVARKGKKFSIDEIVGAISKEEEGKKENLQEQLDDPISTRIEKLEKWIQKIAVSGPGSGEVRLLNLDDVNTTNLANDKILKYQSSSGKFIFVDAVSDSGHTIQNGGSNLTTRTGLNFDGTYIIAADDSGNDQTDITLHSTLQGLASVTATPSELNIVDGATLTTAEINLLDVSTATGASASTFLRGDGSWQNVTGGGASLAFKTIAVSGQSDVVAETTTDTLTFIASGNTTLTTNAGNDTITIDSSVTTVDGGNF